MFDLEPYMEKLGDIAVFISMFFITVFMFLAINEWFDIIEF